MNVVKVVAKTKEEAINGVLAKLNASDEEVVYKLEEIKGGLFKGTQYECLGYLKVDILTDLENYLKEIVKGNEKKEAEKTNVTTFKMYTSNNPIVIGKNGQNLEALTVLARQFVKNLAPVNGPKIILDVEDYKDRQIERLERLAKNLAREVKRTKVPVEMDAMNSYERRIVHNILTDFKGIRTESIGEEPNRRVVIKLEDE